MCNNILLALKPCKHMINSNDVNINLENDIALVISINNTNFLLDKQKSKFFYKSLIEKRHTRNIHETQLSEQFNMNIDFDAVFLNEVVNIYYRKVAEFCYKFLTNILSRKLLLFRSKILDTPECDICKVNHDIKHLLWECKCYNHVHMFL